MRIHSMIGRLPCRSAALVTAALMACVTPCRAADTAKPSAPAARLDRTTVTARGKQSALLTVNAFGRYAVTVSSAQGVALETVDRMAGSGPLAGEAGKQDGRLDLFLDRGEHKIVTYAAEHGSGQATLGAHAFRELHARAPLLVEHRLERASLGDFEQRSYWIEIKQRRVVALEAAGRHLADLRLWREGTWLVAVAPQIVQSQARPDQPLAVARLAVELDPGLYLLTAYGGPPQPWTEASDAKPFLLRYGIPTLAPAMRQQFTMSEFGVERFLVPRGPNHFRLELPTAHAASLQVDAYDSHEPFRNQGFGASIDKRTVPPVAEVDQGGNGERLVTVTTETGKPFLLQHFEANWSYRFGGPGEYWISSIHAGHSEDSVGATAVLTRQPRRGPEELVDDQALDLGDAWHRRFNLLDRLTLFVKVPHPTVVRVVGEGVRARYRFEPFLTSRPRDYQTPPWEESGHMFPLLGGLYVLTVEPQTKGILDLHLLPGFSRQSSVLTPVSAAARFPATKLDSESSYTLYLNRQPGVAAGVILRPLPVDLRFPLPVTQRPGETLTIPVSVPERGTLRARTEDGRALELSLDNGKAGTAIEVEAGRYQVVVRGGDAAKAYSLALEPTRLASTTPLPALPDARLAGLPKFPVITPEAPHYLDLQRVSTATYNVRVDQPGLYQFETTGLLHTGGKVRTRISPSLFEASRNGVGGNFQIQRYLREGDYQLSVSTEGETQGHLGVQLSRTEVVDGGELREGEVARALLPTGQALAYRFRIAQRGSYHLQSLGLGRNFDVRLEDSQGWPVLAPLQGGDITADLEPGAYRLLVMPQTADARVLTRLDRVAQPKGFKGHGPHRITLGAPVSHTWIEPRKGTAPGTAPGAAKETTNGTAKGTAAGAVKGAPRTPDQWDFVLPAAAEVTITLDAEMEATLVRTAELKQPLAKLDARQPWRGELAAGRYRVLARNSRANNLVPYTLQVASTQMLAGQSRTVSAPAAIPVSVGADGLIELESFGRGDVRARLVDAAGEPVAQNDDRPGDWNFQIAQRLRPGQYRLLVDPVSEKRAQTTVSMQAPGEVLEKPLALGKDVEIKGAQVHVYPLPLPADSNVVLASARSGDAVGLALEGEAPQGWVNLGTKLGKDPYLALPLALPLAERFTAYRLRAWSADRRSLRMTLRAVAANLPAVPESQWLQGSVAPVRVDDKRPSLRLAMVALARPGTFRLAGDLARLQWSDSGTRVAQESRDAVIAVSGKALWLVSEDRPEGEANALAAARLRLPVGEQESLRLELMAGQVGTVDLQPNPQGPSLVLAQARAGQPGVALAEARDPAAIGFVPGEVVTVALPGVSGVGGISAAARLWNATSPAAPLELDVRQVSLQQGDAQGLAFGVSEGTIKSRAALTMKLPAGGLRARLTLSPLNAAVFVKKGRLRSTHWAGTEALQETVVTDADQLWLLNAGPADAQYGVDLAPHTGEAEAPLKPGEVLERNLGTAGRLRIPVEVTKSDGEGYRLHIRGNVQALWQENGGRITSGSDLGIRESGVLWLQHRPGTLVAWLDETGPQGNAGNGRRFGAAPETPVTPPQTIGLHGKQQLLAFQLEQPVMLQVRTSVPVVTQFLVRGQPPRTEAHLYGASVNLPAPAGAALLMLRAVGADSLSGVATVTATPATRLAEGPGPEVLLAPGSARLFAFDLEHATTVGIGVRASSDVVRAVSYDAHGTLQSEGVVQMPTLVPGRYYLAVEMPPDSAPVRVQPIVLGLKRPDLRPPHDILRRYVEAKDDGEALLYVPPPPAPPPAATAPDEAESEEAAPKEGEEGEGEPSDESGNSPAEEAQ